MKRVAEEKREDFQENDEFGMPLEVGFLDLGDEENEEPD